MPLTAKLDGELILARDAAKATSVPCYGLPYVCQECEGGMILKAGKVKIPHFAHRVENPDCLYEGETEAHLAAKAWLAEKLTGLECQLETKLGNTRYDVVFRNTVFECQVGPISADEFEQREDNAYDFGLTLHWLWGAKNHRNIRRKGRGVFLRVNDIKIRLRYLHFWKYPPPHIETLELWKPKWSCGGASRDGFEYGDSYCRTLWMFRSRPLYFDRILSELKEGAEPESKRFQWQDYRIEEPH